MILSELAFSLHSLTVTFITSTCSLSLSNCDTALAANSVSLKDLISGVCDYIISNKRLHFATEDINVAVSFLLCS